MNESRSNIQYVGSRHARAVFTRTNDQVSKDIESFTVKSSPHEYIAKKELRLADWRKMKLYVQEVNSWSNRDCYRQNWKFLFISEKWRSTGSHVRAQVKINKTKLHCVGLHVYHAFCQYVYELIIYFFCFIRSTDKIYFFLITEQFLSKFNYSSRQ